MNEKTLSAHLEKLLAALLLVTFLLTILYPVHDPDVFWHLKTGEWIWQHKGLPDRDPFSFTTDRDVYEDSARPNAILKGYWLSELIIYGFHSLFGLYGIILFRCLVYSGLISLLYFWMRHKGVKRIVIFFFLIPSFLIVYSYGGERPNTISYLLAMTVYYLLNEHVQKGGKGGLLLPVLMYLWSLMHGGYLLGEVIIGSYLLAAVLRIMKGTASYKNERCKIAMLMISMIAPALNLHAWRAIALMSSLSGSLYDQSIVENASLFFHFKVGSYGPLAVVIFAVLFVLVVIRKFSLEDLLIGLFTLCLSLSAIRYIPFFVLLMIPAAAAGWARRPAFRAFYNAENRFFRHSMYAMLFFSTIFIGHSAYGNSIFLKGPISDVYPKDAVEFMKKLKPVGKMFNEYDWGGYLIYKIYPEKQVFIDGRGLSFPVFDKYDAALRGSLKRSPDGSPVWKAVMEEYKIGIVLVPICKEFGKSMVMLGKRLIDDPEWSVVFMSDKNSMIFLKQGSGNDELIKKYAIDKALVYEKALKLLDEEDNMTGKWRKNVECGLLSIYLGRYDNAKSYFEKAINNNGELKSTAVYKGLEKIKRKERPAFSDKELEEIENL